MIALVLSSCRAESDITTYERLKATRIRALERVQRFERALDSLDNVGLQSVSSESPGAAANPTADDVAKMSYEEYNRRLIASLRANKSPEQLLAAAERERIADSLVLSQREYRIADRRLQYWLSADSIP